ncbi:hypothetical protein FQN54_008111 [Arachnomyces sp. PD_36]|nr:hypothetical protein FQN54_008111 [Arachnomyces sp. PD_36]
MALPQPFTPIHYIPPSQKPQILSSPLLSLQAIAHTSPPTNPTTNHWSLYVTTPSSLINIDCLPSYTYPSPNLRGGSKANLIISALSALPEDAIKIYTLCVAENRNLTVGDVLDVIVRNGREKYEFNEMGTGCRMWVRDQLRLLLEEGVLVDKDEVEGVVEGAILRLWPSGEGLEIDEGGYYGEGG